MQKSTRIVITGLGLTAPNGNTLAEYRQNLLGGVARLQNIEIRHMGQVHAGVCDFDPLKYQKRNKAYGLCVYFESGSGVAKTWLSKRSFDDRLEELLTAFPDIHAEDINDVFRSEERHCSSYDMRS